MAHLIKYIKEKLSKLSYKTGVAVLASCLIFYAASGVAVLVAGDWKKAGLWFVIFFGLAKTCQYGGLTILGVDGYKRLKSRLRRSKNR